MKSGSNNDRLIFNPKDFRKGDNTVIELVYKTYYEQFMGWSMKNYSVSKDEASDIYGKSVMIFREKTWAGRMENYSGTAVNTIIFAVAKNLLREKHRKDTVHASKHVSFDESFEKLSNLPDEITVDSEENALFEEALSERDQAVGKAFYSLGEKCQKILLMRIVYGLSMDEISEKMQFKNTNSAKTQKNKCFNKLKTILGLK